MFEDRSLAGLFPVQPLEAVRPEEYPACTLVDGQVRQPASRDLWLPVFSRVGTRAGAEINPVTIGYQADLGPAEAHEAIAAAERAWANGCGRWPDTPLEGRITAVEQFAVRLGELADRIATILMFEIGKPLTAAKGEVSRSLEYIKATVAEMRRIGVHGPMYSGSTGTSTHHARDTLYPLGKVLCVAPFNYPINEFLTTIIPALLAGNVVIAKTPRFGVLANQLLASAFAECFPRGTVALLPGDGRAVIPALMQAKSVDVLGNPKGAIDVLAFIGSEQAANAILTAHPTPSFVHKILGLGAKNAAVVLRGADIKAVATKLVKGALGFNGQRCTAEKIVFAPDDADGEALVTELATRVAALPLGMPWDANVAITPLPEHEKLPWMWAYLDDAISKGARIANDGGGRGWFSIMRPAVVDRVSDGMRLCHEEQFGPIVPVMRYRSLDEVLEWHGRSPYGQQAGVHGPHDPALVRRLASFVARVNINDVCQRGPDTFGFTAADKSGFGTLSIEAALRSFSRTVIVQSHTQADLVRYG
jgi:glyceraldehyde-3-phosphate dehydrogenase (NADP+)